MNSKQRTIALLILLLSLLVSGCSPGQFLGPTATPTSTITPTSTPIPPTSSPTLRPTLTPTNTPIPTATLSFEIPKPQEGRGIIVGQILRAGKPASYMQVQLCSKFDPSMSYGYWQGPCSGEKYRVTTNSDGYYIFSKVKPGGYQAIVVLLPTNSVIAFYNRTGADMVSIEAGQTTFVDALVIDQ